MHTFDVYCLLLFVVVFSYFACHELVLERNQIKTKCYYSAFRLDSVWLQHSESILLWKLPLDGKALNILLLLPPPGCVSSLVTMTSATATQNKRPVVIHTVSTTNFHFTLVWCSFCWPRGWFWFVHVNVRTEFVLYRWCMLGRSLNVSCT